MVTFIIFLEIAPLNTDNHSATISYRIKNGLAVPTEAIPPTVVLKDAPHRKNKGNSMTTKIYDSPS
jgi:hypothetical protein